MCKLSVNNKWKLTGCLEIDSARPKKVKKALLDHMKARKADLNGVHKQFIFKPGSFKKLAREIPSVGAGPMVKYKTTMGDLLKAQTTKDLRRAKS